MTAEIPLQIDLFSGALVDTRSASQKARDRERDKPQQIEMFAQRELAQFGVRAHPQMSLSAETKLVLISEDPRTDDERERDALLAAQALTSPLFSAVQASAEELPAETDSPFQPSGVVPSLGIEVTPVSAQLSESSQAGKMLPSADELFARASVKPVGTFGLIFWVWAVESPLPPSLI